MFSLVYLGGASWNDTHFQHERFDKLVKEARSELDEDKRREMYRECQKIIRDEGGAIVYAFQNYVEAAKDTVQYNTLAGNLEADGARAPERWWFKS